ncbi:hypothetical protein DSO57_1025819 [Entomophthora muscae]|uniref:Uncharacterized protein n=1 Tax=Entomophthora muscae TaxID=34485 RepID=A0ACC2UBP3_9FUNG|nr:hypothetical protein DSO57_1025819 [Entomophthora muscae]
MLISELISGLLCLLTWTDNTWHYGTYCDTFGPVHFTKYPPNPAYSEFALKEILIHGPEAGTRETETVYREGIKITRPSLLFRDKYNFLPAYLVPMTPPHTPQPNRPQDSVAANESTFTQIFGVIYITLTGLIDSMVPISGPWAILGKFPNLAVGSPCWARGPSAHKSSGTPAGWIPDTVMPPPAPTRTPWLLTGMVLMALNAYLPQMSSVSSLWYPLQAAVPVLHWAASWWFILPRWEPNLVSLAPFSHN